MNTYREQHIRLADGRQLSYDDLGEIAVPVQLWQGEQDHNVSRAMFDHLARSIPTVQPRLIPGEGHISLIVNHAEEILKALK